MSKNMHEHITEAERVIAAAKSLDVADQEGFTGWSRDTLIALAQVHASLAHALKNAPGVYQGQFATGANR